MVRIPTYWFWFGVLWAGLCLTPCIDPKEIPAGSYFCCGGIILAWAYFQGAPNPWAVAFLIHAALTAVLAVAIAVFQHFREIRKGRNVHTTSKTYRLSTLFWATTVLAVIFGLLASIEAPSTLYAGVLLAVFGQFATAILVGVFERGASAEKKKSA